MPAVEPRYHTLPSTASSQSATALSSVFGGGKCRTHPRGYSRRRMTPSVASGLVATWSGKTAVIGSEDTPQSVPTNEQKRAAS